jgi:hypothetical protein
MSFRRMFWLALAVVLGANLANANISYTCASNIDTLGPANTCNVLNTTISGLYSSTFSNANASIFIQYGTTGLGQSTTGFLNLIPYSTYRADLIATASNDGVDTGALASLPAVEPAIYGGADVEVTSALGAAIGISNAALTGTTANGAPCTPGTAGCFNGIITITNDFAATPLFYRTGSIAPDAFDFYTVVEHETDEVLGTSSCIDTTGGSLSDGCGSTSPSAVDLFRYNAGSRVFNSTTPGAYFSFNGGATNGANGAVYNTLPNGDDYADFITGCPGSPRIQDATACPGFAGRDITNDGGAEINILDAVGYNLAQGTVPEPNFVGLLGLGFACLVAAYQYKRRSGA